MEKSFIFDAVNVNGKWDRQYFSKDYADYFSTFISNGIFPNPSTNLQVIANNDMTVTLKAGKAFINGRYYHNTDNLELKFDIADGVLDRIDTVVIQCRGLIDNGRKIIAVVKKGEFSSEPVPPPIIRNDDIWELRIANIHINHGVVKITQADIEDTRLDSKNCGLVSQMVQTVDTTTLYNQIQTDLLNFNLQEKTKFNEWFQGLKDILDTNAQTHILNILSALMVRVKAIEDIIFSEDITANPYQITFDNLDNIVANGVWNSELKRIEC